MSNIYLNFKLLKKKINNIIRDNNLILKNIDIIAASKNQNINTIEKAILSGVKHFGENYIQESILKIKKLKKYKNITWHFIGNIQSNKIKKIAQNFSWCQTVDRKKTAFLLNKFRPKELPPINVLIQINISKEYTKNGITTDEYEELAKVISMMPSLNFRGIMALPLIERNITESNMQYKKIQTIFEKLKKIYPSVDTLSLGTSRDIKQSLFAKTNMIRIGHDIFNNVCQQKK